MPGFTNPIIKRDYPNRADAIAAVIQMTAQALQNLPDIHPEINALNKQELIDIQARSINAINESTVWD